MTEHQFVIHKLLATLRHLLTVRLHLRRWGVIVSHYAGVGAARIMPYTADAYDVRGWLGCGNGDTRAEAVECADKVAQ